MNLRLPVLLTILAAALWKPAVAAPLPRHLMKAGGALTQASGRAARETGESFTREQMAAAGLPDGVPSGLYLAQEYKTGHNGVTHLVYRQRFQGLDIHNAEWRVNVDGEGRVLNA